MKNINFLLLLLILRCVKYISCNDGILSKFHQDGYKVKDIRVELTSYNEKYVNFADIKTFKYNRTTPAINGTVNFKVAMKDKLEVLVQSYKFLSNEYRHFPIRFQINLKKSVDANILGLNAVKTCGNLEKFIFEKDITYYACNFVIDQSRLPPLMPNGGYRHDLQFLYLNEKVMLFSLFGEDHLLLLQFPMENINRKLKPKGKKFNNAVGY